MKRGDCSLNKKIKQGTALMLALLLTLLCACSGGTEASGGSQPESSASPSSRSQESQSSSSQEPPSQPPESSGGEDSGAASPAPSCAAEPQSPESQLPQTGADSGEEETQEELKAPSYTVLTPVAAGTVVYGNSLVTIDASNASEGYVMIKYTGGNSKVRVLITPDGGSQYTYTIRQDGGYDVFPLSSGSGGYTIGVYENIGGNQDSTAFTQYITASLRASTLPFLYPNQYVNFWSGCNTVNVGAELSRSAKNDLQIVENVYNYVINNISYDFYKAENFGFGYLPSVDNILATGKGICFDYAAVMAAMLRSQMIPTKLVVGYAGNVYHAWISTYITDVGWVNGIIYFDGQSWVRMDPTFASGGNSSADIMSFIGNGSNYSAMFFY